MNDETIHPKQAGEFSRGWMVLFAAFLGIGVSLVSLSYYSAGIWVKPWQAEIIITEQDAQENGVSVKESLHMSHFWMLIAIFFLISTAVVGLIPNFIPLLQDAGLAADQVGSYAAALGVSVMLGRLLTGFLIDRIFAPHLTAIIFLCVSLACISLAVGGVDYALFAGIALGFAVGAEVDLIGYYTARYFGLKNYGMVYGFQYSSFLVGAGISPILAGSIWDNTGNYDMALIAASALLLVVVVLSLLLPRFPEK